MQNNNIKIGKFSASGVSALLSGGTGKTRMNYIYEIAESVVGTKKDAQTKQMLHGVINERTSVEILCNLYMGSPNIEEKGQRTYPVNDYLVATPDAIGLDWVGDAKCQYEIYNFIEQNESLINKYYIQVQTQMMALKVEQGYLINYLTKPEEWGQDDLEEYPFDLKDRYFIHDIKKDEKIQDDILFSCEKYYPNIQLCIDIMNSAILLNDVEFFNIQLKDKVRFLKLKDTNWINNERQVYRYNNTFYLKK